MITKKNILIIIMLVILYMQARAKTDTVSQHSLFSIADVPLILSNNLHIPSDRRLNINSPQERKEITFSHEEKDWIRSNPIVFYSILNDDTTLSFTSTAGTPAGLAANLLNELGQRIGVVFQGRICHSREELYDDIRKGKSALIPYVYEPPESQPDLLMLTLPYDYSQLVIISRNTGQHFTHMTELKGKNIALTMLPQSIIYNHRHNFNVNMSLQTKTSDALNLLAQGDVDAVIADFTIAKYEIMQSHQNELVISGPVFDQNMAYTPISMGIAKNQPLLLSIMNKTLYSLPESYFDVIKGLNFPHPNNFLPRYQNNIFIGTGVVLIIILISLFWIRLLWVQIEKRKSSERKLQDELNFQLSLFDHLPLAMFVVDNDCQIKSSNQFVIDLLDIPTSDVKKPTLFLTKKYPDFLTQLTVLHHKSMEAGKVHFKNLTLKKESNIYILYTWSIPFHNSLGEISGTLSGWLDLSDRTRLEEELRREKELSDQANQAKTTFLSNMSHEIRTPLNVIIGMLELELYKNELTLQQRDALMIANESSQHLLMLIDDILDLSKIEAGKMTLQLQPVSLLEQIILLERMFSPMARKKGIEFKVIYDSQVESCWVLTDPLRLRQILANLLSNAVKFTQQGQIILQCSLGDETSNDVVLVSFNVNDTGIGIAAKDIPTLFSPFSQIEEATKYAGGTGLGLTISRRLVDMLEGEITLKSELGKGTQLHVSAHFTRVQPREKQDLSAVVNSIPKLSASAPILIVDDHQANRILLSTQLRQLSAEVITARSGKEALALMSEQTFDIIITDISMPDMSGIELAKQIRRSENPLQGEHTVIIGLTAFVQPEIFSEAQAAGMDICLRKPVSLVKWSEILPRFDTLTLAHKSDISAAQELQDRLLQALAGQQSAISPFLQSLWESTLSEQIELKANLNKEDWHLLSKTIHKIKGPFYYIHQDSIIDACDKVEHLCSENPDPDSISLAIASLWQQIDNFWLQLQTLGYDSSLDFYILN